MENVSTNTLMEPDQSQLRQMVLENTERIDKQETMIDKILMESADFSQKMREKHERLEQSNEEHDYSIKAIRKCLSEIAQLQKNSIVEHEKSMYELKKHIKENSDKMNERDEKYAKETKERDEKFAKEMKERDEKFAKEMKEIDEKFAKELKESRDETNAAIRRISIEFLGITGHIIEGLASSAIDKIFKEAGLELLRLGKNIKPIQPENHNKMEVDVLLGNEIFVVPVEVKADFTKRKVKRFINRMAMFRTFFPEFADKEIIAAVAAINYADKVDQFAHEEGLLVIRVSSDDIFSLDPFDVKTLRRF